MTFIRQDLKQHFVMAIKSNRTVTVSEESKKQGHFCRIDSLAWSEKKLIREWLKGLDFPVLFHRQVLTNKDGRLINLASGTPFYVYIICDLTVKIKEFAENATFDSTPDLGGYFV